MAATDKCILLGIGNPLLDISVTATEEFLAKYGLERNNAILAEDKHRPMYEDMIATFETVDYVAGGATQNSIRVAQWLLQKPGATAYMGCIGEDQWGSILSRKMEESQVNARYQINKENGTGTCAVLITGDQRSLCAYLGAANHFTKSHLDDASNFAFVEQADFYYSAGFFLTVSVESILEVAKHACEKNKVFMTNLSAPFLCQFFTEQQMQLMPYVDILFGNESEAEAFSTAQKFETSDIKEIALKTAALEKKNSKRPRLVVFTQGADPTIVAFEGKVEVFEVEKLSAEQIVDTNGAGDAFVGGFLAQYVQGASLAECVRCGAYVAKLIIQRAGCTYPDKPDYK